MSKPIFCWMIGMSLMMWLFFPACSSSDAPAPKQEQRIQVETAEIKWLETTPPIRTSGMLSTEEQYRLSFKIGGIIEEILVDEGDYVQANQVLAKLNLAEIEARLAQAENGLAKAKRDLERVENLYQDSVATLEQLQDMKTAKAVAESDLRIAQFNYDHSFIRAPSSGKVLKKLAQPNELIGAGMPILVISAGANNWVVKAGLSERDIVRIRPQDSASLQFDAYPDEYFRAYLTEIAESIDPQSATYEVVLKLAPTKRKLITGFAAQVSLFPSDRQTYAFVPINALVDADGKEANVFLVSPEKRAKKRKVQIAFIRNDEVAIRKGLEDVNSVVVSGAAYLYENAKVE